MADYKLSACLAGHDDDVRAVSFPDPKAVLSGSRDGTVRLWKLLSDKPPTFDATISSHSPAFVNSIAYLPPSAEYPEGLIISGGKDVVIEVRQPLKAPEENAEALLLGHSSNICALDVDPAGKFIVSGGWDGEARIWLVGKWEEEVVLRGHEGSAWAVLAFDSDTIITGCADRLIRIFHRTGKLLRTIKGSEDVVRALCRLPKSHPSGADFASAGNDGIIRLWTLGGQQVAVLRGHDSYIYSLTAASNGELFSSGEDRTLRVWRGSDCVQTITHPAISVWDVAICAENGDIVSGASDRVVRVFTRAPERFADAETTGIFDASVKESSIPQQQLGNINKEELPGPEFLTSRRGTKEGQLQTIKELNGSVTAHQWSQSKGEWELVGTVVDAAASSGVKVSYQGKDYDYVFDVDVHEGKPALKLPFNLSQNPYEAATKFISTNELPVTYLDQVANFIITNTAGHTLGAPQESLSAGPDAWGSEARYRPGDGEAPRQAPVAKQLPHKSYLFITSAALPKIQSKIVELNQKLVSTGSKDLALNPPELNTLKELCKSLSLTPPTITLAGRQLVIKLATKWPYADRMPGLDLLRLVAVIPSAAETTSSRSYDATDASKTAQQLNLLQLLISGAQQGSGETAENQTMMTARGIANLFATNTGRSLMLADSTALDFISHSLSLHSGRNLQIAAATVYLNSAVLINASEGASHQSSQPILEHTIALLQKATDSEVIFRCLVAAGTLLEGGEQIRALAKKLQLGGAVEGALKKANEPRGKLIAGEIRELLG